MGLDLAMLKNSLPKKLTYNSNISTEEFYNSNNGPLPCNKLAKTAAGAIKC